MGPFERRHDLSHRRRVGRVWRARPETGHRGLVHRCFRCINEIGELGNRCSVSDVSRACVAPDRPCVTQSKSFHPALLRQLFPAGRRCFFGQPLLSRLDGTNLLGCCYAHRWTSSVDRLAVGRPGVLAPFSSKIPIDRLISEARFHEGDFRATHVSRTLLSSKMARRNWATPP